MATESELSEAGALKIAGVALNSRLMLGTARYPSLEIMRQCIIAAQPDVITVSLRRESPSASQGTRFWDYLKDLDRRILPNTAGCFSPSEAVVTAQMARDLFDTNWIKLEVIGDRYTLQPDPYGTVEAAEELTKEGFVVFPYTTDDAIVAERLLKVGCQVLMPWGAPIGSGRGFENVLSLQRLRQRFPETTLVVDAGIGKPSHAVQAMELGFDAVLLNTAVATALEPVTMAAAFAQAVSCGRLGYEAGPMAERLGAVSSTPERGLAFRPS